MFTAFRGNKLILLLLFAVSLIGLLPCVAGAQTNPKLPCGQQTDAPHQIAGHTRRNAVIGWTVFDGAGIVVASTPTPNGWSAAYTPASGNQSSRLSITVPNSVTIASNYKIEYIVSTYNPPPPGRNPPLPPFGLLAYTYFDVIASSGDDIQLAAHATGPNKITLYWRNVGFGSFNIYRSTDQYTGYVKITPTPVAPPDSGPGVTNRFRFNDTGLTTGTEYYYYLRTVDAGVEGLTSNKSSDAPDALAAPWDTGNAQLILAKIDQEAVQDDPYWSTTAVTTVTGPNGVQYTRGFAGNYSASAATSYFNGSRNAIVYSNGEEMPVTRDDMSPDSLQAARPMIPLRSSVQVASTSLKGIGLKNKRQYGSEIVFRATSPPSGPFRKVETNKGIAKLDAFVTLPSVFGVSQTAPAHDTAYVYTGGMVGSFHVDAGFQKGEVTTPGWTLFVLGKRLATDKFTGNLPPDEDVWASGVVYLRYQALVSDNAGTSKPSNRGVHMTVSATSNGSLKTKKLRRIGSVSNSSLCWVALEPCRERRLTSNG